MQIIIPDYFYDFKCIAGDCKHTCCVGWEIDIDDDAYDFYKYLNTDLGKRIIDNIEIENTIPHFILSEDERCPFLNKDNLCEIYINLGEDCLCEICSEHPRFRNFYLCTEEIGLGLCCEAACKLIICRKDAIKLIIPSNGFMDAELEFIRLRSSIFDITCDRSISIEARIEKLMDRFGIAFPKDFSPCDLYSDLEYMDTDFKNKICSIKSLPQLTVTGDFSIYFEQLINYFIYRHLSESLHDGMFSERLCFAVLSTKIIYALCRPNSLDDILNFARIYSCEIEYSDLNIGNILNKLK